MPRSPSRSPSRSRSRTPQRRNPSDLELALAGDKNLAGADLAGAILVGANRANLEGANLVGANLEGANLIGANLDGANLEAANLRAAYLVGASLRETRLTGAHLPQARLTKANCRDASFRGANLAGVSLFRASLEGAVLRDADLYEANLSEASLHDANLKNAYLEGADLTGADLRRANLAGAKLYNANLQDADLRSANLQDADFEGANLEGANVAGTLLERLKTRLGRSYGRQTSAVLKMEKPDAPTRAAEFKKRYPAEFERLKSDTQGRDFSDTVRAQVRQKYETPFVWLVTEGSYEKITQRLCPDPNLVFKFNLDLTDPSFTERQREFLKKLADTSRQSGHPNEKFNLFTVGWVRLCVNDAQQTWLVEEVQSDVGVVREKLKDGSAPPGLEEYADVIGEMRPYIDRFYEDAIGVVFVEAEKKGYAVEMLTYESKQDMGSPRSVYTDLPRAMGMQKRPKSAVLGEAVAETWFYKPNPRSSRRSTRSARKRR